MTTEYRLQDGTSRLVSGGLVLSEDETVELSESEAAEFGDVLVPVEQNQCDDCGESFDSAQGLANHQRTHEDSGDGDESVENNEQ